MTEARTRHAGSWVHEISPGGLTLADAVRAQSVRWHSFMLWYSLGAITGKMYRPQYSYRYLYPGPSVTLLHVRSGLAPLF